MVTPRIVPAPAGLLIPDPLAGRMEGNLPGRCRAGFMPSEQSLLLQVGFVQPEVVPKLVDVSDVDLFPEHALFPFGEVPKVSRNRRICRGMGWTQWRYRRVPDEHSQKVDPSRLPTGPRRGRDS